MTTKSIKVAAIQMAAQAAPLQERLAKAETWITQAAQDGAELVVLPEVFNTGYEYRDENYLQSEPLDGLTATWMHQMAQQHQIHLAGSFLRWDAGEIYNTLLLVGPDGQSWHYDKHYPWMWERAYFRPGSEITVADTALGKLGMLICWDVAHPELWARYTGRVDAMIVCSCPPLAHDLRLIMPDGRYIKSEKTGPLMRQIRKSAGETFGPCLRRQASHMGVPVVNTTATGIFRSRLPRSALSLSIYLLFRPDLWPYLNHAEEIQVESPYFEETYIADAHGEVLSQVAAGEEGCTLSEIEIPADAPQRPGQQPPFGISSLAYWLDRMANMLLASTYREGIRKAGEKRTEL